MKEKEINK